MNIGLIAGGGCFPLLFADAARARGYKVCAVAYRNAAEPGLEHRVHKIKWLHLGEIEQVLAFFSANQVSEAVIMGGVRKTVMFSDIRADARALQLISRLAETHDDQLLRSFADLLAEENIIVRASTGLLPELLAEEGCWTKRLPDAEQSRDIDIGWKTAKAVGQLDVGQCVVVEKGTVLAVEAIDGTDATIRRGGHLGGGNAVVVKVCKPHQDLRFDIPAVGAETIRIMKQSRVRTLALEAGRTIVFDRREMIDLADSLGISIVALRNEQS